MMETLLTIAMEGDDDAVRELLQEMTPPELEQLHMVLRALDDHVVRTYHDHPDTTRALVRKGRHRRS